MTRDVVFSDSNGVTGSNSMPSVAAWPWQFANWRGDTLLNLAQGGLSSVSLARPVYAHAPAAGDRTIVGIGTNDMRMRTASAGALSVFKAALTAEVYWLAGTMLRGRDPGWTYTGTWGTTWMADAFGPALTVGKWTNQIGATASAQFEGDVLMLGTLVHSVGGTFQVTVDGVVKGTFNTLAAAPVNLTLEPGWAPAVVRYTGFGPGTTHTVVITALTATGALAVDWLWTGAPRADAPLYLLTVPRMGPGSGVAGSDAGIAQYNGLIAALVSQALGDGLDVTLVDSGARIDPVADIVADGFHYSPQGHLDVSGALMGATSE